MCVHGLTSGLAYKAGRATLLASRQKGFGGWWQVQGVVGAGGSTGVWATEYSQRAARGQSLGSAHTDVRPHSHVPNGEGADGQTRI